MASAQHGHSSIAHRRGRKKRSSSGEQIKRDNSHKASGTVAAQKISPHQLVAHWESPRIRAMHLAADHSVEDFDYGLGALFKEQRERVQSVLHNDEAPMCLSALFGEDRQIANEPFCLDVPFGQAADADVGDHWDFGLRELFGDDTERRGAARPRIATGIAWIAAAGVAVAVPLLVCALRGCRRGG